MIWTVIIILLVVFGKFAFAMAKDSEDLQGKSAAEKFSIVVAAINNAAFDGSGKITYLDKKTFNLYDGSNQIINFMYSTGNLSITWKYKYFQKEVKHEHTFTNARNLSIFEQQAIAETMINETRVVIRKHKIDVLG